MSGLHVIQPSAVNKKGFTLIELLVVIAIIAILAAILFPVFARVRAKARQTACLSNQKQIALALVQYTQDYDETLVPAQWPWGQTGHLDVEWETVLQPYAKSTQLFVCPDKNASIGYGWNYYYFGKDVEEKDSYAGFAVKLAQIESPSTAIIIGDSEDSPNALRTPNDYANHTLYLAEIYGDQPYVGTLRHNGGGVYTYCDGHAKWLSRPTIFAHPEYFHTTGT